MYILIVILVFSAIPPHLCPPLFDMNTIHTLLLPTNHLSTLGTNHSRVIDLHAPARFLIVAGQKSSLARSCHGTTLGADHPHPPDRSKTNRSNTLGNDHRCYLRTEKKPNERNQKPKKKNEKTSNLKLRTLTNNNDNTSLH